MARLNLLRARADKPSSTEADGRRRVLLIDDERDLCTLLQMALEPRGYVVEAAHDGIEGWNRIEQSPPALVVLDIKMPKMNGYQLLARLQRDERTRDIPVVVFTSVTEGAPELTEAEWAERLEVGAFIAKPSDPERVVDAVDRLLQPDPAAQG
ncbi:MAG TPA: response regulator [Candidatus Sumerlaeota bacterium]|nr:MAG: Alkaline phosphatase synthesis transcriptional regulatory protein PhoP [candidate division BRC1 bacterium ADurb.BinA292]HOE95689.1 response regulator [Candidatus Sumerlaeota bacterium]HOR27000.1 response regulator [Candidatus Sumerlaeota bacterium]HPK02399.1 response regulator [Candidatus Sumerlaeota bacterium]